MKCHECGFRDSKVIESRDLDEAATVRRRRQCLGCDARFTTYERRELPALTVIKSDGRREVFNRTKVTAGIYRAAEKRPISLSQIDELVTAVERQLRTSGDEAASLAIGELVMARLREMDDVAYMRFASVYRRFADAASFEAELRRLKTRPS